MRADYEAKLATRQAKRAEAVRRDAELVAGVAALVGDDNSTARLLDVPLCQVHAARRFAASSKARGARTGRRRGDCGRGNPTMTGRHGAFGLVWPVG
jgi:hypothetical protein